MCINDDIKVQYLASDANIKEFKKLIGRFMKRMFFMKTPAGTATMDPTRECNWMECSAHGAHRGRSADPTDPRMFIPPPYSASPFPVSTYLPPRCVRYM